MPKKPINKQSKVPKLTNQRSKEYRERHPERAKASVYASRMVRKWASLSQKSTAASVWLPEMNRLLARFSGLGLDHPDIHTYYHPKQYFQVVYHYLEDISRNHGYQLDEKMGLKLYENVPGISHNAKCIPHPSESDNTYMSAILELHPVWNFKLRTLVYMYTKGVMA